MKISVIFPDIWSTQNLTPQHRTIFRRVAECFTSLLDFSCVFRHSQASNSELPGNMGWEKQWFSSAKWSQLPTGQDSMWSYGISRLWTIALEAAVKDVWWDICILHTSEQVSPSVREHPWQRMNSTSSLSLWDRETWSKECVTFQGNQTASWTHCREEACERSSVGPVGKEQDVSQIWLSSHPPLKAKLFMWCLWGWVVWEFF